MDISTTFDNSWRRRKIACEEQCPLCNNQAFVGPELIIFKKKVLEIVFTSVFNVLTAVWLAFNV